MLCKKDKLKPIQPYFVFDTDNFYQEVYLRQGISHFYTYTVKNECPLRIVPDGCINLFFEYDGGGMKGYAFGTKLEYTCEEHFLKNEVFGVRFMPGVQPALLGTTMKGLIDKKIPIEDIIKTDSGWLNVLAGEKDFYQRIRVFLEAYTKAYNSEPEPFGKKQTIQSVKQMVYDSDGKIKISQIQENTGYSERYINKIFIEEMGFSPKIFCKIIQFQRALEFLNYGSPDKMTDAAVNLGYYDQPQFIRDFKKYCGVTPLAYLKMTENYNYKERVKNTRLL